MLEVVASKFCWVNWIGSWTTDGAQWTRSWGFWHGCVEISADCQSLDGGWLSHFFKVNYFMDMYLK
jgi:hypothetical protein